MSDVLDVSDLEVAMANAVETCAGHAETASTNATAALEAKLQIDSAAGKVATAHDEVVEIAKKVDAAKTAVTEAEGRISDAETSVTQYVDTTFPQKVEEATKAIDGKVAEANDAKTDAVKAKTDAEGFKGEAEGFAKRAEIALNNGCVYEVRDINDASISIDKTITIYKHEPTADTAYTFATPTDASGKVCVFWLWIKMGATAHALTFPASVEWLAEPSLGANTETLLALMSVDNGATWTANVQWEKAVA